MIQELKSLIKRQSWWYLIADSIIYQKLKNAAGYSSFLKEIEFYGAAIGASNKLVFDVGANVGTKSKIFSRLSEKVVLFEPDRQNLKILNARLKHNSRCIINACALSSQETVSTYYSIGNDGAYNSLSKKHIDTVVKSRGIINEKYGLTQYEVNTKPIDYFIYKYGIPDYIKIDVEGYEKEVIFGLTIPVPKLSIEANLPQFIPETIDIINYLDQLSKGKYLFNYVIDNHFELKEFITASELINELDALHVKSIEIYCFLNEEVKNNHEHDDK